MLASQQLIHNVRSGLFGWYNFPKDANILQASEIMPGTDGDKQYDYIVSNADLEKTSDPGQFLMACKKLLKEDGHLLLAVNNRFGLKYFCGDRDPYTDRNFDGIEDYKRAYGNANDTFSGRCYSKAELQKMLSEAGFEKVKFYSVLTDLDNPSLIYAEDFLPNEDMTNRVFPTYHYKDTVFLEEAGLYNGLIENGMFHQMANAYLIECTVSGKLSDVCHVTGSMERGEEDALFTMIHKSGIVEKRAAFEAGISKIAGLYENTTLLASSGVKTVNGYIENHAYYMPFVHAEVGQVYLKRLFFENQELFLEKMDAFRDLILKSAPILSEDAGDGEGAILKYAFFDMVPLNSFYMDDTFVFYDQEFRLENYPANVIIYRMVVTFYAGDIKANQVLPMTVLFERYGLTKHLKKWQDMERKFMIRLRKEEELMQYHNKVRADYNVISSNRQRMNYSADEYQRLFVDIFKNADTRKLFLFGSGNYTKKFLTIYGKDYNVQGILDNNESKWGQELDGIMIQSPDVLKQFVSGEYKVIICIKNYLSVMKQLDKMGIGDYAIYDWNKDYPRKLKAIAAVVPKENEKPKKYHIGYVAGAFDMFHVGHLNLLRRAKEMCDYLIVGVISDESIYRLKNKNPIIPCDERVEIVAACRYVDQAEALPTDYSGIRDAYKMFHFDVQFSGDDHGEDAIWQSNRKYLESQGADIVFFPYTQKTSSTKIRKQLSDTEK